MMGRTEGLARELRHARGHEHAQLRGDVPGTAGQHIGRVIHHDVDRQLVNGLHGCGLLPATRSGIPQMTRETYASALPLANLKTHLSSRKLSGQARTTIGKFRGQHTHLSCFFQGIELRDSLGARGAFAAVRRSGHERHPDPSSSFRRQRQVTPIGKSEPGSIVRRAPPNSGPFLGLFPS